MLKQMLKPYSFMHQNVKMEKEQHTELNKVLMFISPILDIKYLWQRKRVKYWYLNLALDAMNLLIKDALLF